MKNLSLAHLADHLNATLIGNGAVTVSRLVHPAEYNHADELVLAMDEKLLPLLAGKIVQAAVISHKTQPNPTIAANFLQVARPRLAMAHLTRLFATTPDYGHGIHPSAVIDPTAEIAADAVIGAFCTIGARARIGAKTVLQSHVTIEANAVIGSDCVLRSGVRIGADCVVGNRALIHFNTTLGCDGFSFVTPETGSVESAKASGSITNTNHQGLVRIYSLGAVTIGDDVEIGANTSIDRGTIISTRIGRGTKIDNQVQIGHNVQIGEDCMICGRVGIAGSVVIGNRVVIGGASGIADHVKIGDDAMLMGGSGVSGNIPPRQIYGGMPAMPRQKMVETHMAVNRLKFLADRVAKLEAVLQDKTTP